MDYTQNLYARLCTMYTIVRRVNKKKISGGGLQNIAIKIVPQDNKTMFSSLLEIMSWPPSPPGYTCLTIVKYLSLLLPIFIQYSIFYPHRCFVEKGILIMLMELKI